MRASIGQLTGRLGSRDGAGAALSIEMPKPMPDYTLRINLRSVADKRRFCEVHVKDDNVYMFQPRKGGSAKISYHKSGQRRLKVGKGPPLAGPMFLDPPERIDTEEERFCQSFENFAKLISYSGEPADEMFEIELPPPSNTQLTFAVLSIGRFFVPQAWKEEGVILTTLAQREFVMASSPSRLSICARVLQLHEENNEPDCPQQVVMHSVD